MAHEKALILRHIKNVDGLSIFIWFVWCHLCQQLVVNLHRDPFGIPRFGKFGIPHEVSRSKVGDDGMVVVVVVVVSLSPNKNYKLHPWRGVFLMPPKRSYVFWPFQSVVSIREVKIGHHLLGLGKVRFVGALRFQVPNPQTSGPGPGICKARLPWMTFPEFDTKEPKETQRIHQIASIDWKFFQQTYPPERYSQVVVSCPSRVNKVDLVYLGRYVTEFDFQGCRPMGILPQETPGRTGLTLGSMKTCNISPSFLAEWDLFVFFLNYCHIFVECQAMEGEWWCHQMVPIHLNAMRDPHCKLEARKEIMWSLAIKASSWGLKWLMIPSWHIFACLLICWRWFPSAFLLVLVILDTI